MFLFVLQWLVTVHNRTRTCTSDLGSDLPCTLSRQGLKNAPPIERPCPGAVMITAHRAA
jgi:hypothetical protein